MQAVSRCTYKEKQKETPPPPRKERKHSTEAQPMKFCIVRSNRVSYNKEYSACRGETTLATWSKGHHHLQPGRSTCRRRDGGASSTPTSPYLPSHSFDSFDTDQKQTVCVRKQQLEDESKAPSSRTTDGNTTKTPQARIKITITPSQ